MSMQGDIQSFLTSVAEGATGKDIHMTPDQMALQTGISRDKVNKTLNNLSTRHRIELLRGPNGRAIIGYRLLEPPADRRRRDPQDGHVAPAQAKAPRAARTATEAAETPAPATRRRRLVFTPMTDAYEASKARYAKFVESMGDRVEASFREDPQAEEAVALKERLALVEDQLHEATAHNAELERDVRALRTRHVQAVERKAVEAGAVAINSD